MTTEAPSTPPRKKLRIYWWIGGLFLLLLVLFLFQLFGPNPKIIISPQTTYITEPLRPDGLPDYGRYLLESSREGVTPDNNGAALLWRAMWPGGIDIKERAAFAAELGITDDLETDHPLQTYYNAKTREHVAEWLNQQGRLTLPGQTIDDATIQQILHLSLQQDIAGGTQLDQLIDLVDTILDRASSYPWTSKEYPPVAAWVADNKTPLDLLVEATKRSHFYSPSPALLAGEQSLVAALPLGNIQTYREVAPSLPVRAMWHAGEGRPKEAWQDLLAVHRIANYCAAGTMAEYLRRSRHPRNRLRTHTHASQRAQNYRARTHAKSSTTYRHSHDFRLWPIVLITASDSTRSIPSYQWHPKAAAFWRSPTLPVSRRQIVC